MFMSVGSTHYKFNFSKGYNWSVLGNQVFIIVQLEETSCATSFTNTVICHMNIAKVLKSVSTNDAKSDSALPTELCTSMSSYVFKIQKGHLK
jgi:hypothetical protein